MREKTITVEEWEAKGNELFGTDRRAWRFQCPVCGHACSINEAAEAFPEAKGKGWRPSTECIGRYTDAVDCDWCAYGLFQGPLFVEVPDRPERPVACFDFEGLPFTGAEAT